MRTKIKGLCPRCERGLMIPENLDLARPDVWSCSFCGVSRKAAVYTDDREPLRDKGSEAPLSAPGSHRPGSVAIHGDGPSRRSHRLVLGGRCRSGSHTLTTRNLYVSPRGVARCEDCRRQRHRSAS
jgi:hypothetical protein